MGDWAPLLSLLACFVLLLLINRWISQHLQGVGLLLTGSEEASFYFYFIVLFPGILLHELSHWLMAKLLGLRTGRIRLWPTKKGRGKYLSLGSVEVAKSDPLRDSLVGLAPLLMGCGVLLLVSHYVFDVQGLFIKSWGDGLNGVWAKLKGWLAEKDFWMWLYLIFCVSNAMMPSAKDREPWKPVLIFLGLVAAGFYLSGWFPHIPASIEKLAREWALSLAYSLGFVVLIDFVWAVALGTFEKALELATGRRILY
ncbi:MAG: hypothetical protein DRI61_05905 [Chloroflexi bacterium]|nr:MAG: hypothetical protein DRI61_05905 [Chloroflexota bacterium]